MERTDTTGRPVKTAETVFAILESIHRRNGARVSELSDELGLAKSTVHRHLTTLIELQYVVKEGDVYHPGLKFLDMGEHARNRKEAYVLARAKVRELAEETNERVQFIVEEHGQAVYVHREIGEHAVETDPGVGKRIPLHATAAGKAILAYLPSERVAEIIERRDLPEVTENTITDEAELYEELDRIREREYSFNQQENIKGLNAIGVPVIAPDESVVGALSVSSPTKRMKGEWDDHDLPELLLGAANELELNMSYKGDRL